MDFEQKKLSQEAEGDLHAIPLAEVRPYTLIFTPAYVHMRINQKFVSVKGPLDFFLPEELAKLSRFETLFFAKELEGVTPFLKAGARVRSLLKDNPADELKAPPFVISDAILRAVAPLWTSAPGGESLLIAPLNISAFVNELCDGFAPELLVRARDVDVQLFDTALLRSSWAVFAALHLGHLELRFLSRLRDRVFHSSLYGVAEDAEQSVGKDLETLANFSYETIFTGAVTTGVCPILSDAFESPDPKDSKLMQKMESRMKRVQELASA